ncbi:mlh1 [Candida pseudojiufengensis]|uniref:mlh1 n=1 Tax=Candida pseudojiufengensis TaxID=497109 RepID=UPI0022254C92|nr:mlh1 [Candida pseudojiufengensis]KAI5965564.1 mlh1 [Candida pseudojiufengensis]
MSNDTNKRIHKLDDSVINKIAAGEIIIQPANALKEMLENSIDAKSTNIEIIVKEGGLKLLQITDNGTGINKDDLPLLCERFTTSKLNKFEDLETIETYGFRGEALSSISHISKLSVITKTKDSNLAYKAYYMNGQLSNSSFKSSTIDIEPKPIAGRDGTQIIVEDLFYNLPSRFKGLKSKSDEFAKIIDIVGRYAVHTQHVGFSCKKFGDPLHQLNTRTGLPLKERIRIVYGSNIANELLDIEFSDELLNQDLGLLKVSGAITNANYNNKKKIQPIIFINHRLVNCDPLKRAINSIFQYFLPKGSHPFFYISLQIKTENLDVNIHPTKREVRFLNEEEIIELIVGKIHTILSSVDTSRKFKTQTIINKRNSYELDEEKIEEFKNQPLKKYRQENKLVRVDATQSKINPFLVKPESLNDFKFTEKNSTSTQEQSQRQQSQQQGLQFPDDILLTTQSQSQIEINPSRTQVDVNLDSIRSLKQELSEYVDKSITNIFNHAIFIGIIDPLKRLCCFQYDVKLFLCDYASILLEFYYQLGLNEFNNFGEIEFDEPISLIDILKPIYDLNSDELIPMDQVINNIASMKEMYKEYFQIYIDDNENLITIPMILKNLKPDFKKLPFFIYRLGTKINYKNEKQCLNGILRQIALFYLPEPFNEDDMLPHEFETKRSELENQLENLLFPELKKQFLATKILQRDLIQIADLPGLYKVFERC